MAIDMNIVKRMSFGIILIMMFLVSTMIVSASIDSPTVFVNETGNITSISNPLSGNISADDSYEYRAFRAKIGNMSYYNPRIPKNSKLHHEFNRSFNKTPFFEDVTFFSIRDELTIQYNVTSNFSYDNDIDMTVRLPGFCSYLDHNTSETLDDFSSDGQNMTFSYHMQSFSTYQVNVTCRSSVSGERDFPRTSYNITGNDILPEYKFNVLPYSQFSTDKERIDGSVLHEDEYVSEWRLGFGFRNNDPIPVNITNVNVWAVPLPNATDNPRENTVFEANYSVCDNTGDSIMEEDDVCKISDVFLSKDVPIMWSEVSYDVIWDFNLSSEYIFNGDVETHDFDFLIVNLTNPENDSYADFEEDLNMGFTVTAPSTCSLYSNVTGVWEDHPDSLENITEGNHSLTTFNYTGMFIWNVFCTDMSGKIANFAEDNYTVNVNKLQENIVEIPDLEWDMDTNYTLNMTDHFWDFENDSLNYSHKPDPVSNITIDADNETGLVRLIPDKGFFGDRTVSIVSTDPFGRNVSSNLFLLNVTAEPEITYWNITNGTWWTTEDEYIETEVGQTLNFTADAEHPAVDGELPNSWFYWLIDGVIQQIGKFFEWSIDFLDVGLRNVTLVVNDTQGLYDMQSWMINVSRIEEPPHLNQVPDQAWKENTTLNVNLTDWLYDPYMEDHNFTFNYSGYLDNLTIDLSNDTNNLSIEPDPAWTGIEERWMQITATNSDNLSTTTNNFTLTVYPYIIKNISDVALYTNLWNDTINLTRRFNDDFYDWTDLNWSAYADNLEFMLNPASGILNITSVDSWVGNETVELRVSNNQGWNDTGFFDVEVLPKNYPPHINDTNYTVMQNMSFPSELIDLWEISYDPIYPHGELNYEILSQSNESLMSCEIVDNRYVICDDPIEEWGNTTLGVSVSDGFYTDTANINIFVEKYIHPPKIEDWTLESDSFFLTMEDDIYDIEFLENNTLDFLVNVSDIENRSLEHRWWFNDTMISDNTSASIDFDFHSSGDYSVEYIVNNTDGGESRLLWNLSVINLNRPPSAVTLTNPFNGTFHTDLFEFNWTNSTDPDAGDPNEDDFWEISYILQASTEKDFRDNELARLLVDNETNYVLDGVIPDGHYHWRVLAYDGADSTSSEVWEFTIDVNKPEIELEIDPEFAEFGLRDVGINWSVSDVFLDNHSMNVTYPNGSLLGEFEENITLTPDNLTEKGEYSVNIFANDTSGNLAELTEIFTVMDDTEVPEVELLHPEDNAVMGTKVINFDYNVQDINDPQSCELYVQRMNIIYDPVGGIIHKEDAGPWQMVQKDNDVSLGQNSFVYGPMSEDSYSWNVLCTDFTGNSAMAESNRTFRLLEREIHLDIPEYPFDNTTFADSESRDGVSLEVDIGSIRSKTGERVTAIMKIENTGEHAISDISFISSSDWVHFDEVVSLLEPGNSTEVPIILDSPVYPDRYIYHVGIFADGVRTLASGALETYDTYDVPLEIYKRIYSRDDGYNISLTLRNKMKTPLNIYLEESLIGMDDVVYSQGDFHTSGTSPPYIALSDSRLSANETVTFSYTAEDIDFDKITESLVITDVDYDYQMEVIAPHNFNILLYRRNYAEIILIITVVSSILIMMILYYMYRQYIIEKMYK